jgi:cell wall-associated NlpC family hydrolase
MPYLGRPYCAGVFDCYSLVRDFYKREFQIDLGQYPYVLEDGRMGHTLFVEKYEKEGFEKLVRQEPKRGDVFILQMNASGPNHVAVYLGDEIILHHAIGRLSRRDVYGGYWAKHTTHHLRHKGLTC